MPAAPEIADKTKHSVTLSWKPPERDGGSPIKGYIIQIQDEGKSDWVQVNDPGTFHPTTEFTVPSLRELKRHRFRIIAVNDIGESDPSPRTGEVLVEDIQRTSDSTFQICPNLLVLGDLRLSTMFTCGQFLLPSALTWWQMTCCASVLEIQSGSLPPSRVAQLPKSPGILMAKPSHTRRTSFTHCLWTQR